MLRVLDIFSGIGGFSLGLERTGGFTTVAFCEIDPYCRAVLRKHWPGVPVFEDVRQIKFDPFSYSAAERAAYECDVICGGFPCQDISFAGKGAGIDGSRSGLWGEYARLIGELRPRYAIVENVSALLGRGLERVLGYLAEIGYDAEWHCIPASAVGAPHRRDRIWIVAYPAGERFEQHSEQNREPQRPGLEASRRRDVGGCGTDVAYAARDMLDWSGLTGQGWRGESANAGWWLAEPDVGRVAHGVPARVDRLRALGNAVVPQVVEVIGRAILLAESTVDSVTLGKVERSA